MPKTRVKLGATVDFHLTLKPSAVDVEIVDETDESDVLELSWNDTVGIGKVSITMDVEDLKKVLKVVE